ncbi:MAG: nucleotidyltransferase domain-containing protein [Candidatus Micrarchaeota archaeon]
MNITELFSTGERQKILGYLLSHPSQGMTMRALAKKLGLSAGQIHKYFAILGKEGLFEQGRLKEGPLISSLRLLWNVKRIEEAGVVGIIRHRIGAVAGIGLYGSWASGTNAEGSDLDLWVKTEAEPEDDLKLAKARKEIESRLGVPVDVVIASSQRLARLREKSDAFYFSLYNGRVLWGEGL